MIVVLLSSSLRKRFFRSHTLKPRPLSQPRKPRHTGALVLDLMLEPSDLRRVPEGRFKPPIDSVRVLPIFEYNLPIRTPVALLALLDSGGMAERSIAPVLKTGDPQGSVGSNPTPSARLIFNELHRFAILYRNVDRNTSALFHWIPSASDRREMRLVRRL
jgi:hypothetical protein